MSIVRSWERGERQGWFLQGETANTSIATLITDLEALIPGASYRAYVSETATRAENNLYDTGEGSTPRTFKMAAAHPKLASIHFCFSTTLSSTVSSIHAPSSCV